jgi:hypothetical protein
MDFFWGVSSGRFLRRVDFSIQFFSLSELVPLSLSISEVLLEVRYEGFKFTTFIVLSLMHICSHVRLRNRLWVFLRHFWSDIRYPLGICLVAQNGGTARRDVETTWDLLKSILRFKSWLLHTYVSYGFLGVTTEERDQWTRVSFQFNLVIARAKLNQGAIID